MLTLLTPALTCPVWPQKASVDRPDKVGGVARKELLPGNAMVDVGDERSM